MTAYFVGDMPSEALVVAPQRDGESIDLDTWDEAVVLVDGVELAAEIDGDTLLAEWPEESLFTEPGLYPVLVVLSTDTATETFSAEPVVVQDLDGWHTLATARASGNTGWTEASDASLYTLLSAARFMVETFAPVLDEDASVPLRYRQAQLLQARTIHNASRVSGSSEVDDPYSYTARPLDSTVRALLRPVRGRPLVG